MKFTVASKSSVEIDNNFPIIFSSMTPPASPHRFNPFCAEYEYFNGFLEVSEQTLTI